MCDDFFGRDKAVHFLAGVCAGFLSSPLVLAAVGDGPALFVFGLVIAASVLAGLGKELADVWFLGGHFCPWDWAATALGGVPAALLTLFLCFMV